MFGLPQLIGPWDQLPLACDMDRMGIGLRIGWNRLRLDKTGLDWIRLDQMRFD